MANPKTFCIAPWTHATVHTDLTYKPCCYSFPKEQYTDKDEWWNSEYMKGLRKSLWNSERHPDCARCWKEEDQGSPSLRNNYNSLFSKFANFKDIKESVKNNFIVKTEPVSWDLRVGNLCNIKCVMCNPMYSTKIAEEDEKHHDQIIKIFPNKQSFDHSSIVNWDTTNQGKELLDNITESARWVKLQGGEPLAVKTVRDFIENLHEDTVLNITTNGTVLDKRLLKALSRLKQVDVSISLEAASNANDIIRYGSSWTKLEQNILELINLPNVEVQINHVLQITSVFYLPEVINFAEKHNLHLKIGILDQPDYLSLSACPKDYLVDMYKSIMFKSLHHPKNQYIKSYLHTCIQNTTFNQNHWQEFKKYVKLLDTIRTEKYSSVLKFKGETYE